MTILLSRSTYIHWYRFCFKRNLHIITVAAGETLWNGKNRQFWWSINWFLGKNVKFFWSLVSWTDSPSENTVHSSFKSKDTVTRKIWHFSLKISLSTIKIVCFCHLKGSPQRRRLRRRLSMSIACLPCIPSFNHYHFVKLTSVLTYMFIHFYLNENDHRRRRWGTPCI